MLHFFLNICYNADIPCIGSVVIPYINLDKNSYKNKRNLRCLTLFSLNKTFKCRNF